MSTEHQQPKEHCDHECVCDFYISLNMKGDDCPMNDHARNRCENDTRSRPHPAPAECGNCKCVDCIPLKHISEAAESNCKEAAHQAREDVLDELLEYINPHSNAGLVISSLRHPTTPQREQITFECDSCGEQTPHYPCIHCGWIENGTTMKQAGEP